MRTFLAIAAGAFAWFVGWMGVNAAVTALFPGDVVPGEPIEKVTVLVSLIASSAILSVLAGWLTARTAESAKAVRDVRWLATLQMGLGLFFQISYWSLFPIWYHVIFLGLVIPATLYGGRIRTGSV